MGLEEVRRVKAAVDDYHQPYPERPRSAERGDWPLMSKSVTGDRPQDPLLGPVIGYIVAAPDAAR